MTVNCRLLRNSPSWFRSLRAFHCAGLCEAVMMIPPHACSEATATSVVGVEASPMFTTSNPMARSVGQTSPLTIGPDTRASRPTTMRLDVRVVFLRMKAA